MSSRYHVDFFILCRASSRTSTLYVPKCRLVLFLNITHTPNLFKHQTQYYDIVKNGLNNIHQFLK